jgi:hypothetical protein
VAFDAVGAVGPMHAVRGWGGKWVRVHGRHLLLDVRQAGFKVDKVLARGAQTARRTDKDFAGFVGSKDGGADWVNHPQGFMRLHRTGVARGLIFATTGIRGAQASGVH